MIVKAERELLEIILKGGEKEENLVKNTRPLMCFMQRLRLSMLTSMESHRHFTHHGKSASRRIFSYIGGLRSNLLSKCLTPHETLSNPKPYYFRQY
jgi:DNA repair protein RadC